MRKQATLARDLPLDQKYNTMKNQLLSLVISSENLVIELVDYNPKEFFTDVLIVELFDIHH